MEKFLTANWEKLILVNYVIDENLLTDYLPPHTQIDYWNGKCYISLVGFMFKNTRIKGIKIPFHVNFEEVNLRFYVKHKADGEIKNGTSFIKEIVPRRAISFIANRFYNEHYVRRSMDHLWEEKNNKIKIKYEWQERKSHNFIMVEADKKKTDIVAESEEEFIAEHYWGYTKIDDKTTSEYQVEHPTWQLHPVKRWGVEVDFGDNYGQKFQFLNKQKPSSVILAAGSEVSVNNRRIIKS